MSATSDASEECGARLYDDRQDLRCDRSPRHYSKPHRAVGSWMANDARHVNATVTWAVGGDEWEDDPA